ncbi:MAG: N-acetyltransferase family protein [Haloglomus sp.]
MTRTYPDEPADEFPRPPATDTDHEGRELTIRVADAETDTEDRAQGIPPVREEQIRTWLDNLLDEECLNVLALHDEVPIGHATLVPDRDESYELAIFVLDEYQGAGVGTCLLNHLLGHAQSEGVEKVWLTVERWNDPAIALYRKVGFEMCSTESFEMEMSIRL